MVCLRFRGLRAVGVGFQLCIWVVNQMLSRSFDSWLQKEKKNTLKLYFFCKETDRPGKDI